MRDGFVARPFVRALRDEAATAGNLVLVAVCDLALDGEVRDEQLVRVIPEELRALPTESARARAWERCTRTIADATLR